METMFLDIFKVSPILGIIAMIWFYQRKDYNKSIEEQRKDYTKLVEDMRQESKEREEKMKIESREREDRLQDTINKNQEIIHKNQEIISDLADKFDVVENIQKDVAEIKVKLEK